MTRDTVLFGVFLPSLLVWALIALPLAALLRRLLARLGWYRFVWHRPLFDLALLVILVGAVAACAGLRLPS